MGNCPDCYFKKWLKTDKFDKDGIRYWKCGRCGKIQIGDRPFVRSSPRVVYLDIETSLTELHNFGLKVPSKYLSYKMIKNPFYIICWSAMVVGQSKVYSACVTKEEAMARTDKNILAPLWELMDGADILAGHNINHFDLPKITGRFIVNGWSKIEKVKTYDTKLMAKRHKFESNSLDYLCTLFGIKNKDKMEIDDWIAIQNTGDEKALKKMLRYNRGDVRNGVDVLNILLGWHNLPNEYGTRMFPKDPKRRPDIQDTLDNIEYLLEEQVSI